MSPARAVVLASLLLAAAAASDCSDGTCAASMDQENAALLQHSAAKATRGQVNTTVTTTHTCYPNQATNTCGNPDLPCFLDTEGCSASGGGACCKAAGSGAGLEQCRFCSCHGENLCASFPQPDPTPPPGGDRTLGQTCGQCASTSYYNGECVSGLVCKEKALPMPDDSLMPDDPFFGWRVAEERPGACFECQHPGNAQGAQCGVGSDNHNYGDCGHGLTCYKSSNAPPGAYSKCVAVCDEDYTQPGERACAHGSCTCSSPAPCRGWAGECIKYCSSSGGSCFAS